jgi:hypothetical protein
MFWSLPEGAWKRVCTGFVWITRIIFDSND